MAVLVSDSFNRANNATLGTTDGYAGGTAKTWNNFAGVAIGISANQAYVGVGNDGFAVVDAVASDVNVQVTHTVFDSNSKIVFRWSNATNYIWVESAGVYKKVNGVNTKIGAITGGSLNNGAVFKVTLQASTITVYFNDVQKWTGTETFNQAATNHGIGIYGIATGLDNFIVEDLATGGTGTPGSVSYATKQSLYQSASAAYATKQSIYQTGNPSYATQQNITDGGIPGSVRYATKQVIRLTSSVPFATKQAIWRAGSSQWATMQRIMDFVTVIGRVNLQGEHITSISLAADMDRTVSLQGSTNPPSVALEGEL